jgi:hypothetical protein
MKIKNRSNNKLRKFDVALGPLNLILKSRSLDHLEKFAIQFAYGHREILLDYMGLERSNIFIGTLQHGVSQLGLTPEFPFTRNNRPPRLGLLHRAPLWVYSESTCAHLKLNGIQNVEAIGAPWNYIAHEDFRKEVQGIKKKEDRYLVLPEHFNFEIKNHITNEQVRSRITHWKRISGGNPITLCLYWTEYLDPVLQRVCFEEGVKVVTAGNGATSPLWSPHPSRINFLHELSQILQKHTHCIVERETSAVYYAISLGLNVGYFPGSYPFRGGADSYYHKLFISRFPKIFNNFIGPENLQTIANEWLGLESVRTPSELMRVLRYEYSPIDY